MTDIGGENDGISGESHGRAIEVAEWANGYDPANAVDQAVLATRRAVFPEHGLDPATAP
jgi:hypothetical protein